MRTSVALRDFSPSADQAIEESLVRYKVPGAAVVIVTDDAVVMKLHGVESFGGPAVTDASLFSCGSTSKAFVSALGAVLAARQVVSWNDQVVERVPEWQMPEDWQRSATTYRDLCGNRTGLSRRGVCEYGADLHLPVSETFSRLRHTPLAAPFRDSFTYLNLGHVAAAIGFGRAHGDGFSRALQQELLGPLGMHDTLPATEVEPGIPGLCGWHRELGGKIVPIMPRLSSENELGGSGVLTSPRDAARWLSFQLGETNPVVPFKWIVETHQPVSLIPPEKRDPSYATGESLSAAYALGWAVSDMGGRRVIRHGGNDPGMSAHVAFVPEEGVGVAVYLNRSSKYCAMECSYMALGHLLGIQRDWRAMIEGHFSDEFSSAAEMAALRSATAPALAQHALQAYTGYFDCPYSGPAHVFLSDQRLHFRVALSRYHSGWLKPVGEDRFLLIGGFDCNEGFIIDEVSFSHRNGDLIMDAGWAGEFRRLAAA